MTDMSAPRDGFRLALATLEPDQPAWPVLWGGWMTLRIVDRWLERDAVPESTAHVLDMLSTATTHVETLPPLEKVLGHLANTPPSGRDVAENLLAYARVWRGYSAWGMTLDVVERVARTAEKVGANDVVAQALTLAGFCRRQRGEWAEAEQVYAAAIAAGEISGNSRVWFEARASEAYLHVDRGDLETGQRRLEGVLVDANEAEDQHSQGRMCHALMVISLQQSDSAKAIALGYRAIQLLDAEPMRQAALGDLSYALELSGQTAGAAQARRITLATSDQPHLKKAANLALLRLASSQKDLDVIREFLPAVNQLGVEDPQNPEILLLQAGAQALLGDLLMATSLAASADVLLEHLPGKEYYRPMREKVQQLLTGGKMAETAVDESPRIAEALAWLDAESEAVATAL